MNKILAVILCFIAINASAQQTEKIDYELHKRSMPGSTGQWYSVIIHPLNPAKDHYKAYCRYIVKQVMKNASYTNLTIVIYDDKKAYEMYEGINNGQLLSKAEMHYTEKHEVAIYSGKADDPQYEESYQLVFYSDAHNGFGGQEIYKP